MGDILEISVENVAYKRNGPVKRLFKGGIFSINCDFPSLIVACANGSLATINKKTLLFEEESPLGCGPIVSLASSVDKVYALTQ